MRSHSNEILAGPQAVKYGALPKVELPADDVLLSFFARQLLAIIKAKGIYRRDNVPMFPYSKRARLEILDARTLRSWIENFLVCYKTKIDSAGDSYDVLRTMNRDTAEAVLKCIDFWQGLQEVVTVNPIRLPVISSNGQMRLLEPGYDEDTRTVTFEG